MHQEKMIPDFPGYTITTEGKVITYKQNPPREMKTWLQKSGYENIKLCRNNITYHFLIHRLVAEAFIPNPNNLPEVNHINKNRSDNRVENLEWCTRLDNLYDSYSTLSATRNYKFCRLVDKSNILLGEFGNIKQACSYAAEHFDCSYSSLMKYGHSKGIILIK